MSSPFIPKRIVVTAYPKMPEAFTEAEAMSAFLKEKGMEAPVGSLYDEGLRKRVKNGEDFSKVAKESSEDADSAPQGGDLGYITAGKTNSAEFEKAALALKATEISNIVETPFGFHIIKADEKRDQRTATFAESKEYIQGQLKEQAKRNLNQEFLKKLATETGLTVIQEQKDTAKP